VVVWIAVPSASVPGPPGRRHGRVTCAPGGGEHGEPPGRGLRACAAILTDAMRRLRFAPEVFEIEEAGERADARILRGSVGDGNRVVYFHGHYASHRLTARPCSPPVQRQCRAASRVSSCARAYSRRGRMHSSGSPRSGTAPAGSISLMARTSTSTRPRCVGAPLSTPCTPVRPSDEPAAFDHAAQHPVLLDAPKPHAAVARLPEQTVDHLQGCGQGRENRSRSVGVAPSRIQGNRPPRP
jgi:hypothetical protein